MFYIYSIINKNLFFKKELKKKERSLLSGRTWTDWSPWQAGYFWYQFNWSVAVYWNAAMGFYSCIRPPGKKNLQLAVSALVTDLESVINSLRFWQPRVEVFLAWCHTTWSPGESNVLCVGCWRRCGDLGVREYSMPDGGARIVQAFKGNQRAF